jgi:hypothetical protein
VGLQYGFNIQGRLTSQVTPDGGHFVFTSSERLTAYNNFGSECEGRAVNDQPVREPGPCGEVYLYAAATETLACVSCNPSGAPPAGSARLPERFVEGYHDAGIEPGTLQTPRAVSDDGNRVFFSSPDQLTEGVPSPTTTKGETLPLAINWEYEPNVYEYENGVVHLIAPSAVLVNSTPSGNDVFLDTFSQLTPTDQDGSPDVYDARVGGGFPALAPPACAGASCQGNPAPAPIFSTPASVTFSGPGNFPPAPTSSQPPPKPKPKACKKGFVRKKGRCVRRHKTKKTTRSIRRGK